MGMEIAVVRATTPASTGTVDFTSVGFGTPVAAIFYMSYAGADGSPQERILLYSEGYTDGSSDAAIGIVSEDGWATSVTARRHTASALLLQVRYPGTADKYGTFNSWITNGVRINWIVSTGSEAMTVVCVLIKGVSAKVGSLQTNTTQNGTASYTGTSFTPDIVFISSIAHSVAPSSGAAINVYSSGIAINDGSETQKCYLLFDVDNVATTVVGGRLETNSCCGQLYNDALTWTGELTAFNANGFTITTRDGSSGGDYVVFLCLTDGGSEIDLQTMDSPAATGNKKYTTSFAPEGAWGLFPNITTIDSIQSSDACFCSFAAVEGGNEYSVGVGTRDNVGTSETYDITDSKLINVQKFNAIGDYVIGNINSWDNDGLTVNYTTVAASAKYGWMFLFGTAVGYTLTADGGSYGMAGQAIGLLADRKLPTEAGSYNLTGTIAELLRGYPLIAEAGAYTITGQDVGLKKDSKISSNSGVYNIAGQDIALLRDLLINVESGTYGLTGSDVTLIYTPVSTYTLIAGSGTYSLTGSALDLLRGYHLGIEAGTYALSGGDVSLLKDSQLSAQPGTYNISGQAAALLRGYLVNAEQGNYDISGQDIAFLRGFVIGLEAGGYDLSGQDVELTHGKITIGCMTITFDSKQPSITFDSKQPSITFEDWCD